MQEQISPMSDEIAAPFENALTRLVSRLSLGFKGVERIARLSGGASQETWFFEVRDGKGRRPLILRRALLSYRTIVASPGLAMEARLMELASEHGVPSPRVLHVLRPEDGLGEGFLMDYVPGETIPRKILRDPLFDEIRPKLAFALGTILARIHAMEHVSLRPSQALQGRKFLTTSLFCKWLNGDFKLVLSFKTQRCFAETKKKSLFPGSEP